MDIIEKIDLYINEAEDELIVQWDEAQRMIDKMKKGKVFAKKETRVNKTLVALATEAEKVMAKRDLKKMENWFKRLTRRMGELKNSDDAVAYRHLYVKLTDLIRAGTKEDWRGENWN